MVDVAASSRAFAGFAVADVTVADFAAVDGPAAGPRAVSFTSVSFLANGAVVGVALIGVAVAEVTFATTLRCVGLAAADLAVVIFAGVMCDTADVTVGDFTLVVSDGVDFGWVDVDSGAEVPVDFTSGVFAVAVFGAVGVSALDLVGPGLATLDFACVGGAATAATAAARFARRATSWEEGWLTARRGRSPASMPIRK